MTVAELFKLRHHVFLRSLTLHVWRNLCRLRPEARLHVVDGLLHGDLSEVYEWLSIYFRVNHHLHALRVAATRESGWRGARKLKFLMRFWQLC